jgi:large subunit ribosomal protein L9
LKIILKKDVKSLGKEGDLCDVSDGYGRNYLLPRGLAIEANKHNVDVINSQHRAKEAKEEKERNAAKVMADRISSMVLTIEAGAGDSGKLFGAITNKDISNGLKKQFDISIDKKKIENVAIKNLSEKDIGIKLFKGVSTKLKVRVVKKEEEV